MHLQTTDALTRDEETTLKYTRILGRILPAGEKLMPFSEYIALGSYTAKGKDNKVGKPLVLCHG